MRASIGQCRGAIDSEQPDKPETPPPGPLSLEAPGASRSPGWANLTRAQRGALDSGFRTLLGCVLTTEESSALWAKRT